MPGPKPLDFPYTALELDVLRMASESLRTHGQEHASLMLERVLARPEDRIYAKPGMAFGHFIDDILRDKSLTDVKKGSAILELVADDMGHLMHARQVEAATAAELRKALRDLVYDLAKQINYLRDDEDYGDDRRAEHLTGLLPDNLRDLLP